MNDHVYEDFVYVYVSKIGESTAWTIIMLNLGKSSVNTKWVFPNDQPKMIVIEHAAHHALAYVSYKELRKLQDIGSRGGLHRKINEQAGISISQY